jgi:hypothetical protein
MAIFEPLGLTRRTLLTGAAALLATGTAGITVRPARAQSADVPRIRAAAAGWTGRNGELLVLTADAATGADYALRILEAGGSGTAAELGPPLPLPLPGAFHPHSMSALGPVLWITGATETASDQARPALVRIENGTSAYAALPIPDEIRSGIATAITPLGPDGLAVAIEGCSDPHLAVIAHSHLATSADRGRTWTGRPLATGLGEGYGTVMAETDRGFFAAIADGTGAQAIHFGTIANPALSGAASPSVPVTTLSGVGRPMAAVAGAAHVSVFSDHDGTVTETRFTTEGTPLESSRTCDCRGEILAVPGRRGLWLEIDGSTVHIRE